VNSSTRPSIQCGEAIARRRKEDGRVGSASRGMVRRWGRFFSHVRPRVSQIARGGLIGATPRGQPWTSAVTLPPGRNGLIAWRMAVWWTFREPSLCRHVHRELLRSVLLDLTRIIAATACHKEMTSRDTVGLAGRRERCTRLGRRSPGATTAPEGEDHVIAQARLGCNRNVMRPLVHLAFLPNTRHACY
jgi:hypothetical protein